MKLTRLGTLAVAALAVLPITTACGSDPNPAAQDGNGPASAEGRPLPPDDPAAIMADYDPQLEPMGWRLTRANLIDRSAGGYEIGPNGTHLALYVEPIGEPTPEEYAADLVPLTALFAEEIFVRWPALESFDMCQEPIVGVDDRPEPRPVTQVELTREQTEAIDWQTADLETLIAARLNDEARVVMSGPIQQTAAATEAIAAATATSTTTTSTTG
jgi:hypothetical protein